MGLISTLKVTGLLRCLVSAFVHWILLTLKVHPSTRGCIDTYDKTGKP